MGVTSNISGAIRDPIDAALTDAIAGGLPLVPRPYAAVAESLGISEGDVIARLGHLIEDGVAKRFGVVVRHRELGYRANAMVVWAVPEQRVAELGRCIGHLPFVTLSYRRPPRPPDWPYNLFSMIHGRDRDAVLSQVEQIKDRCGLHAIDCAVLFSARRFKQRGAHYGGRETYPPLFAPPRASPSLDPNRSQTDKDL